MLQQIKMFATPDYKIIIIIIIIILRMSPVTGISSWYFSWTSGDPHRSGFKLRIEVLSVLCVMFQV